MNAAASLSQAVIDSITAQIAVLDGAANIIAVNRAWRDIARAAAVSDSLGGNYLAVCRAAAATDPFAAAAIEAIEGVLRHDRNHAALEYPCTTPDGDRWFIMEVTRLEHGSGAVVTHSDITERVLFANAVQASEARYRHLFEHNVAGVVTCRFDDGVVLDANRSFAQLLGHAGEHDLRGESLAEYADLPTFEALRTLLYDNGVFASMEALVHRRDGRDAWLIVSATRTDAQGQPVIHATCMDITDAKQADEMLRASKRKLELAVEERTAELRALAAKLMRVQEEERARIARDIHDEFGQALTELNLGISMLRSVDERHDLDQRLVELGDLTRRTTQSVQRLAADLRPALLDRMGLVPAIESRVNALSRSGVQATLTVEPAELAIESECAMTIYRIVQEALTNVVRHARASRVIVRIRRTERSVTVTVRDNGAGMSGPATLRSGSLGLLGMRERAHMIGGRLRIRGRDGHGTVVRVDVPNRCGEDA